MDAAVGVQGIRRRESMALLGRHRPVVMGRRGMVVAAHPLAALAGLDVLRRGGHAVDAALATNAALAVTQPGACGPGGDLFALIYEARTGRIHFLNASGRSPGAAHLDAYRSRGLKAVPERGILAVTVPGCIDGWAQMHRRFGRLAWEELLAPAVELAEAGFPLSHLMAQGIAATAARSPHPTWQATYLPEGRPPRPGQIFRQPQLAASLRLLAREGPDAFYRGPLGRAFLELSAAEGGLFAASDLAAHQSEWGEPLRTVYRGVVVYEPPPNTQGLTALQALNICEGWDLGGEWAAPERVHRMVEAMKLALQDRDRYLTDPAAQEVPVARLLDKGYAAQLRQMVGQQALPMGADPWQDGDTTYFAVADEEGNLVSCVQSLYKGFGSLLVIPGTGICLHNRGSAFSLHPNAPHRLAPRKRPRHTLMASLLFRPAHPPQEATGPIDASGERPWGVFGTMGGDGQAQTHLQVFSNLIDHGLDVQAAIEAPRWCLGVGGGGTGDRNALYLEGRFPQSVTEGLAARGHRVIVEREWEQRMGHAHGILIEDGVYHGGADPRGDGYALAY